MVGSLIISLIEYVAIKLGGSLIPYGTFILSGSLDGGVTLSFRMVHFLFLVLSVELVHLWIMLLSNSMVHSS